MTHGYLDRLLAELKARRLPIPPALTGEESMPLALSTRADMAVWAAAHGYDEAAVAMLKRLIAATVRSGPYQKALAADLSMRHSLDGEPVELVSEMDRHSAALALHARALKDAGQAKPPEKAVAPKPVEPGKPTASPPKRPIVNPKALTPQEIERRRVALASLP
jgi:hypothetical protein